MPTSNWDLALAEIIYYVPTSIPTLYCVWTHRSTGLVGWLFLFGFTMLQLIGSGLTLSAGENGTPSKTAIIITSVGLSPLLIALAGIVKEWAILAGFFKTERARKYGQLVSFVYHIVVVTAVAIYAVGASDAYDPKTASSGSGMWKTGAVLLLLSWLVLPIAFAILISRVGKRSPKALFWALMISLALLGVRVVYQCVATFKALNPLTSSIALTIVFEFLTGVLIILAMVTGGIMISEKREPRYNRARVQIPLTSAGSDSGNDV